MINRVRIPGLATARLPGGVPVKAHILKARAQKAGLKLEAIRALDGDRELVGYEVLAIRHEYRQAAGEAWIEWIGENWARHLPEAILDTKAKAPNGYGLGMNVDTAEILGTRGYNTLRQLISRASRYGGRFPLTLEWTEHYDARAIEQLKLSDEQAIGLSARRLATLAEELAYIAIDDACSESRCYSALTRMGALIDAGLPAEKIVLKFDSNPRLPLTYARALAQAHPGPVVLEGVCSTERMEVAREIGADWVQGYAVSDSP